MGHRHTPDQIAGNAPINQALIQMLIGNGFGQLRPVLATIDPGPQPILHLALQQIKVTRVSHLNVARPRDGRIGIDQIGRVQQGAATITLVAARLFKAALGAGALDIAVGQEPLIGQRLDHLIHTLLDQALGL